MRYPPSARRSGIQGTVVVSITIGIDGKIVGGHVEKSVSPDLDAAAINLVSMMPSWIPGKINGKATRSKVSLQIHYAIKK